MNRLIALFACLCLVAATAPVHAATSSKPAKTRFELPQLGVLVLDVPKDWKSRTVYADNDTRLLFTPKDSQKKSQKKDQKKDQKKAQGFKLGLAPQSMGTRPLTAEQLRSVTVAAAEELEEESGKK